MLLPVFALFNFFPSVFIFFFLIWPVAVFHHWAEDVGVDHAHADGYEGETQRSWIGQAGVAVGVAAKRGQQFSSLLVEGVEGQW